MSWRSSILLGAAIGTALALQAGAAEYGRTPTPDEIKLWDMDILPDGKGLPVRRGTVAQGKSVDATYCEACQGAQGQGGIKERLVGGQGMLASDKPIKTVGSYWPYATTPFDYIGRAMPYPAPGSLSTDDTYAVAAYILNLNNILPDGGTLDQDSLLMVQMPNRDGFIPEPEIRRFIARK